MWMSGVNVCVHGALQGTYMLSRVYFPHMLGFPGVDTRLEAIRMNEWTCSDLRDICPRYRQSLELMYLLYFA